MIDYRALAARRRNLGYRRLRSYVDRRPGEADEPRRTAAGTDSEENASWRMVAPFSTESLPRFLANKLRYSFLYKLVGLLIVLFTVCVSSFLGIAVSKIRDGIKAVDRVMHGVAPTVPGGVATEGKPDLLFLVLGADDMKGERGRSDAVMLVHVNLKDRKVRCLSVPRDSYVNVNHKGAHMDKLNHAYFYGGPELAIQTVQDYVGVKVDFFGVVNYQLFESVVDLAGGVPLDVDHDMDYDDNAGNLHVHLRKGPQILDGVQAKGYVRFRHDNAGDFGRMKRQQNFAKAMLGRLKSPKVIALLALNIRGLFDFVQTDVPLDLAMGLLYHFKDFDPKNIEVKAIPSDSAMIWSGVFGKKLSFMLSTPEEVTSSREWLMSFAPAPPKATARPVAIAPAPAASPTPTSVAAEPAPPRVEARIPNRAAAGLQ